MRRNKAFVLYIALFYIMLLVSLVVYVSHNIYLYKQKYDLAILLLQQKEIENYISVDIYESYANDTLIDKSFFIDQASIVYKTIEDDEEIEINVNIYTTQYSYNIVIVLDKITNKIVQYEYGGTL